MTQLRDARSGVVTPEMEKVAEFEQVDVAWLREQVASGRVVIPANRRHQSLVPCGIGEGLQVKVNSNIGTSSDRAVLEEELEKLRVSIEAGADTVMDLSTGKDMNGTRKRILAESTVAIGTVPIYQAVVETVEEKGALVELRSDKIFEVIEKQAQDGVDFITVHCGLTLAALELLKNQGRITNIVSRGGSFLTTWMLHHGAGKPPLRRI